MAYKFSELLNIINPKLLYLVSLKTRFDILNLSKIKLETIPGDLFAEYIAPNITISDLVNLCHSNKNLKYLCNDPYIVNKTKDRFLLKNIILKRPEIAITLIKSGYDKDLDIALILASKYGYLKLVEELLKPKNIAKMKYGPNLILHHYRGEPLNIRISEIEDFEDYENDEALNIHNEIIEVLESPLLLADPNIEITAFNQAIRFKHMDIVDLLLTNPIIKSMIDVKPSSVNGPITQVYDMIAIYNAVGIKNIELSRRLTYIYMELYQMNRNAYLLSAIVIIIRYLIKLDMVDLVKFIVNIIGELSNIKRLISDCIFHKAIKIFDFLNNKFANELDYNSTSIKLSSITNNNMSDFINSILNTKDLNLSLNIIHYIYSSGRFSITNGLKLRPYLLEEENSKLELLKLSITFNDTESALFLLSSIKNKDEMFKYFVFLFNEIDAKIYNEHDNSQKKRYNKTIIYNECVTRLLADSKIKEEDKIDLNPLKLAILNNNSILIDILLSSNSKLQKFTSKFVALREKLLIPSLLKREQKDIDFGGSLRKNIKDFLGNGIITEKVAENYMIGKFDIMRNNPELYFSPEVISEMNFEIEAKDSIGEDIIDYKYDNKKIDTFNPLLYEIYKEGYEFYYFAFFAHDYKGLLCREPTALSSRLAAIELTPETFEIGSGGPAMNYDAELWYELNDGYIPWYDSRNTVDSEFSKIHRQIHGYVLGWSKRQLRNAISELFGIKLSPDMRLTVQYKDPNYPKFIDLGITHKSTKYEKIDKSRVLPISHIAGNNPHIRYFRLFYRYFMGIYDYYDWPYIKTNHIYSNIFIEWVAKHFYFIPPLTGKGEIYSNYDLLFDEIIRRSIISKTRTRPIKYFEGQEFFSSYSSSS